MGDLAKTVALKMKVLKVEHGAGGGGGGADDAGEDRARRRSWTGGVGVGDVLCP